MSQADFIANTTTVDYAPDRQEVRQFGAVECHYALKGNLNSSHPEQQDRAVVFALQDVHPDQFHDIMQGAFDAMQARHQGVRSQSWDFVGDCCATMAMLDPVTGKLALGSKGDGAAYIVMRNKNNPQDVIIERISSPHENCWRGTGERRMGGPNTIGYKDVPVMWANMKSWSTDTTPFFANTGQPPAFELIDVKNLADAMLQARHTRHLEEKRKQRPRRTAFKNMIGYGERKTPKETAEDYDISILIASDGIAGGKQNREDRLQGIAQAVCASPAANRAQAVLDYVSSPSLSDRDRSHDNLSAILLPHLTFGKGDAIAACICDGNHRGIMSRVHDGSVAAQAVMEGFEEQMHRVREQVNAEHLPDTKHQDDLKKEPSGRDNGRS